MDNDGIGKANLSMRVAFNANQDRNPSALKAPSVTSPGQRPG
jgi:hypothetical protein